MTIVTRKPTQPAAETNIAFTVKVAAIRSLLAYMTDTAHLGSAQALASWDLETQMPAGGITARGPVLATLAALLHGRDADPRFGRLIDRAEALFASDPERFSDADRALIREARRMHKEAVKLPEAFVRLYSEATTASWKAWKEAKAAKNFALFAGALKQIVDLARERAQLLDPDAEPYAVLFDHYEPGMGLDACRGILERVRVATVALLQRISAANPIDTTIIQGQFPETQQLAIARTLLETIGYQFNHGRIDLAAHPFETSFGSPYDVRVTTRYNFRDVGRVMMPAIHEGGHALYEQGIDPRLAGSGLAQGTSLGIHESQSRGWENIIGRSESFWRAHFSKVQAAFPGAFDGVDVVAFVRALNAVQAQPIRVEADELTYNLHIIIRFELEQDLIMGRIEASEAREAWNAKYQEYLGITPRDDAEGVLQDIHWSHGSFGYFSTYSLGNFYAAQFAHQLRQAFPDMDERLAAGETSFIREWQRGQIHRWGRMYLPADLCRRVTGETLNPDYFIRYVTEKYTRLYQLG